MTNGAPKISVIMPVYNCSEYLRVSLESVLNQSFSDLELICIDDCSTDNSYQILEEYRKKDGRIQVHKNKENLRAAGTRNAGLEKANGEYVYFIDSDDYIDNDYLQQMYDKAVLSGADIVTNTNITTEIGGASAPYIHPSMPEIPDEGCFISNVVSIEGAFCVVWMRLFKRSFLEKYKIRFQRVNMTEDNVFHFVTGIHASSIYAFRGEASYHYVIRDDSVTGIVKANNQRDYVTMRANELIFDYLKGRNLLESNRAVIFRTAPFFKVDTMEKFLLYKTFFNKAHSYIESHRDMYSDVDMFFMGSILSSGSLEDYLSKYPSNVAIAFLRKGRKV